MASEPDRKGARDVARADSESLPEVNVREAWQIQQVQAALVEADTGDFADEKEVEAVASKWRPRENGSQNPAGQRIRANSRGSLRAPDYPARFPDRTKITSIRIADRNTRFDAVPSSGPSASSVATPPNIRNSPAPMPTAPR